MKSKDALFEKFEENFYFKISRVFWHGLLVLGSLALVVGAAILIWGITPSFMGSVEKPNYPPPIKVSAGELKALMFPGQSTVPSVPSAAQPAPVSQPPSPQQKSADKQGLAYESALNSLRALLPPEKFAWQSRGHWVQSWFQRQWVVDVVGIEDQLQSLYSAISATDYAPRTKVLDAFVGLIKLYPVEQRGAAFSAASKVCREGVDWSVRNISLLKETVPIISSNDAVGLATIANFISSNPNDGPIFIAYADTAVTKFDSTVQKDILATMIVGFYRYFPNNIDRQIEATNLFVGMAKDFEPKYQVKALNEYYGLFVQKNRQREYLISQMDRQYQADIEQAKMDLVKRKVEKAGFAGLGWRIVGGSVVFIALVAMFLVLLSIQRNIKMMREGWQQPHIPNQELDS